MAITLKTQLLNKFSASAVESLGRGELNFYMGKDAAGKDVALVQVGGIDGQLKTFAAPASDVHSWAKAATRPTYEAKDIVGLEGFISGQIKDTNTQYKLVEENGQLILKAKDVAEDENAWKTVEKAIDVITPAELTEVLKGYVVPEDLAIYATKQELNAHIVEANSAIAEAKKAGTDAASALNTYKTANDVALAEVKETAEAATTVAEVNTQIDTKITALKGEKLWDAKGAAADAQAAAISAASADAASKANAAQAAAEATAAADATSKANAAEAAAKAYADGLASNYEEAGAAAKAQAAAISAAEADATAKANAAQTAAEAYADGIKADLLGEGAISETYDTLKEIADWIESNGVDATELTSAIAAEAKTREDADKALSSRIKAYEDAKGTYATVEALNGVKATAEAAQTATEVSNAIDAKIEELNLDTRFDNDYDAKGAAEAAQAAAATDATNKANAALEAAKTYADEHDADTTYGAGTGLILGEDNVFSIDPNLVLILDANKA